MAIVAGDHAAEVATKAGSISKDSQCAFLIETIKQGKGNLLFDKVIINHYLTESRNFKIGTFALITCKSLI